MRFLLLVYASDVEKQISRLLIELSKIFATSCETHLLLVDDCSADATSKRVSDFRIQNDLATITLIRTPYRFGYGGCQKIGYRYAIEKKFDCVVSLKADCSASSESISSLFHFLRENPDVDCALGVSKDGLSFLSAFFSMAFVHNALAKASLRGWYSPLRAYKANVLSRVPFELNAAGYHFDTELLLQFLNQRLNVVDAHLTGPSVDIPFWTVGFGYFKNALKATLKYKLQRFNLFYDVRFQPDSLNKRPEEVRASTLYDGKLDSLSPSSLVCQNPTLVAAGSRVLDVGCSTGYVSRTLAQSKHCRVTGIDVIDEKLVDAIGFEYRRMDLEQSVEAIGNLLAEQQFDHVLLLDVLEHLSNPEIFLLSFSRKGYKKLPRFLMSTGNVAFVVVRLMLLFGFFNYGKQGILDITHKRLFAFRNFRHLLEQTGFVVTKRFFFPLPFQKLGLSPGLSKILEKINLVFIKLAPSLFAYQIMFEAVPSALAEDRTS